jgi:hypothetical protein
MCKQFSFNFNEAKLMALPFILWGAAALLAGTGVVKGVEAKNNFEEAENIGKSARRYYENAESEVVNMREETNSKFEELGKLKLQLFNKQIKHLVEVIKKSKHASSKLSGFNQSFGTEELKEMERLVLKSLEIEKGLGTGAATGALAAIGAYGSVGALATTLSTGTAIGTLSGAAATNATLAWLGGGALSAGGFGMAGGAIALGGIVLGPALAVGGFMMASKAEEALTQAHDYRAKIDIAVAEMDKIKIVLSALQTNAKELGSALNQMAKRFDSIKVYNDNDEAAFEQMVVVGKGLKSLLDVAIMDNSGVATKNLKSQISGFIAI